MERCKRFFVKAITVLGRSGYTEGSCTDLNIRRFIQLYSHPLNKDFSDPGEQKVTDKLQKPDWPPTGKISHPI